MKRPIRVSASRLKTLCHCSMAFYYQEIVKVYSGSHVKTRQGSAIHACFEHLLQPKRRARLERVIRNGFSFADNPSIARFIRFYDHKHILMPYRMEDMESMLRVAFLALKPHFFVGDEFKPPVYHSEWRFQLTVGDAVMSGFIDLLLLWPDRAVVIDVKSQGQKWVRADVPHNLQAAIYSLSVYDQFKLIPSTEFIMVRHPPSRRAPDNHLQCVAAPSVTHLEGLRAYVSHMHHVVNSFGLAEAYASPTDEVSFCERVCGFMKPARYLALLDKDGDTISSFALDSRPQSMQDGETLVERTHEGCSIRYRPPT